MTRNRIVEAGRAVFYAKGYEAATMEEVAKLGGLSRTTLYQHFPNKSAIMEGVLEIEVPRFQKVLQLGKGALTDQKAIEGLLRRMQEHYRKNLEFITILRQAVVVEGVIAQRIDESYRAAIDLLSRQLPEGLGGRDDDVRRTRLYICLSATNAMLERCLQPDWKADRDIVFRELVLLWCSMFDLT